MKRRGPQHSLLFRVVAFFSRLRFGYLIRSARSPGLLTLLFALISVATSVATLSAMAVLMKLPLLFPPLAPSAFILFRTPLAESACPRNVVLSHTFGIAAGLASLHGFAVVFPGAGLEVEQALNWYRVGAIAVALGGVTGLMVLAKTSHPPAAASALIAVMGYLEDPLKVAGFLAAVLLLAAEGFLLNRVLGGLPYPVWRADPAVVRDGGALAGIPGGVSFWSQLSGRTFQARKKGRQ